MEMEMDIPKFDNISVEILSRLPANSLLRFRWACKYWFNLIRDLSFVDKHLSIHHPTKITSTTYDPVSVLISSSSSLEVDSHKLSASFTQFSQCYIDYTSTRISSRTIMNALPSEFNVDFRILGSCHGLLFFSYSSIGTRSKITTLCIWNPCTKEYRKLPPSPTHPPPPNALHEVQNYGFGYDCTINDYKVIRNTYFYASGNNCIGTHVQVYTLGVNAWKSIGHMISCTLLPYSSSKGVSEKGVFVNGALYWIGYSKSNIISFDIGKETYQEILNLPEFFFHNNMKLEVFEGSLCLLSNAEHLVTQENFTEMWVMENKCINNNIEESTLTKLSRIPRSLGSFTILKPLMRLTTNDEILFLKERGGCLFSFDSRSNSTRILNRVLRGEKDIYVEAVYTESLVSLHSGTYTTYR